MIRASTLRTSILAGATFAIFVSSFLTSCEPPNSLSDKSGIPADHVVSLDGARHKRGFEDPYVFGNWCGDARCHHINLRGGFALAELDNVRGLQEAATPSCYQCHGELWTDLRSDFVRVLEPAAGVVWPTGTSRLIEWWAPAADSSMLSLYRGSQRIAVLGEMTPRDGVFRLENVESNWGRGNNFQVQIDDSEGNSGSSRPFSICPPDEIPSISSPNSDSVVVQLEELFVFWECASGVVVDIFLYRGDDFIDVLRRTAGNSGAISRLVSSSWGTGDGFRIQMVDEDGNVGYSEEFRIVEAG